MPYSLEFAEPVRSFLRNFGGLSRSGRIKLYATVIDTLRNYGDTYRADPELRQSPDPNVFVYDAVFADGGRLHRFVFEVDDSAAAFGVLRLLTVSYSGSP
jgi:hypothetical protein